MRFAVALVALLAAAALILTGVAQRTILKPPAHVELTTSVPSGVGYVVVPASVLRAHPGAQRVRLAGPGTVFAAYGRSRDVTAWLGGQRYAELGVDGAGDPTAPVVRTAPLVAGLAAGGHPDPNGSDLWLGQRSAQRSLDWSVRAPSSVSLLIASDGTAAAPSQVHLTWPGPRATPLAIPLIIAGGVLAVVGLLLYVWALAHVRRRRGPRRKPPTRSQRGPRPPRVRAQPVVSTGPGRGRRSGKPQTVHRLVPGVGLAVVGVLAVGFATPEHAAQAATPTASVTEGQARRIVQRVAETAEKADDGLDLDLAATRFAGPALDLRKATYRIRKKAKKAASKPLALPTGDPELQLILPEATTTWPRTLFVVVADGTDDTIAPQALTMVQDDPRSDYTVRYDMALMPGAKPPVLPNVLTGAQRLDAATSVLKVKPVQVATDYGALLQDSDADVAEEFGPVADALAKAAGEHAKKKAEHKLGDTAGITFSDADVDPDSVVAMSTADAGALVSVALDERWKVKPKGGGVTVTPSGGTKILAKTDSTGTGIVSVYGYQLLFSVPSAGSDEPVRLLGYAQGLVSAKEL